MCGDCCGGRIIQHFIHSNLFFDPICDCTSKMDFEDWILRTNFSIWRLDIYGHCKCIHMFHRCHNRFQGKTNKQTTIQTSKEKTNNNNKKQQPWQEMTEPVKTGSIGEHTSLKFMVKQGDLIGAIKHLFWTWSPGVLCWVLMTKMLTCWSRSGEGPQRWLMGWSTSLMNTSWKSWGFV